MKNIQIVPPQPRKVTVLRRRKARFCGVLAFAFAMLTLVAVGVRIEDERAVLDPLVVAGAAVTALLGAVGLALRFSERPREVTVRQYPYEGPVIHFRS